MIRRNSGPISLVCNVDRRKEVPAFRWAVNINDICTNVRKSDRSERGSGKLDKHNRSVFFCLRDLYFLAICEFSLRTQDQKN